MLKASQNSGNDTPTQSNDTRGPFQSPTLFLPAGTMAQGAHPNDQPPGTAMDKPVSSDIAEFLSQISWSYSSNSNTAARNQHVPDLERVFDRDTQPPGILDTSFYGMDESGLNDSFLQCETEELVRSLSLENLQLHVHSSPNRLQQVQRMEIPVPRDMPSACEFETDDRLVEPEAAGPDTPLTQVAVQPTGCWTETTSVNNQAAE